MKRRQRVMGVLADFWVVFTLVIMIWLGTKLFAVPFSCNCPFKDPTQCWWWHVLYC